jgi:hypothetical protein
MREPESIQEHRTFAPVLHPSVAFGEKKAGDVAERPSVVVDSIAI